MKIFRSRYLFVEPYLTLAYIRDEEYWYGYSNSGFPGYARRYRL
jgi:hypothetical protein